MSKVFISYSTQDEDIAQQIHCALDRVGAEPFLASLSLQPGVNWTEEIFNNLKSAEWVFFIATQSSCSSPAVQQELGASLSQNKNIIPILIDISPSELPGWVGKHQAIDARKDSGQLHVRGRFLDMKPDDREELSKFVQSLEKTLGDPR